MRAITILLIFVGLKGTYGHINAQTHDWIRTNPGGGGAYSTIGASVSGIIIAGSDLSGAYRSVDGGQTWDVIGASRGLTITHVSGVGFDRVDGDKIYIGTESGIFRSTDGGDMVVSVLDGGYITDIEFGTAQSSTGYATWHPQYNSNNGVIFKSTDDGLNWAQVSTDIPAGLRILKIVVNPSNVDTAYMLTGNGRFAPCGPAEVFRTVNGGINWVNITENLPEILDIAVDQSDPQNIFITTMNANCNAQYYWTDLDGQIFKSTNGGTSWGDALSAYTGVIFIENTGTIRLVDPREPYPWVASAGTWTSTDGGVTFSKTGDVNNWDTFFNGQLFHSYGISFNGICKTLGEDLSNPANFYWVNIQYVFGSNDFGTTFNNLFTKESPMGWSSRGFDNVNMQDICIQESDPELIYIGYFDIGLWRSDDRGQTWNSCNPEMYTGNWDGKGGNCATVIADPDRENVVWASMSPNQEGQSPTYLLRNESKGDINGWSLANLGLPDVEVMGLALNRHSNQNSRTLYVTGDGDVYKSTDDGLNWSKVWDCNGCRFTAVDEMDSSLIYAGGEVGIMRSRDAGVNWDDVSHPEMKATPGRQYWDRTYDGVFDIKPDPNFSGVLYVTAIGSNKGLYKSEDVGDTWEKVLTDDYLRKVEIVPTDSDMIYATSSSSFTAGGYNIESKGIQFSDDGGLTWTQQNQNMPWPFALAVEVDHTTSPLVFVGSPGTGFQKSAVPLSTNSHIVTTEDCVELFPNPFENYIVVDGVLDNFELKIFDISGNPVGDYSGSSNPVVLNLGNLGVGVYFLSVQHNLKGQLGVYMMIKN